MPAGLTGGFHRKFPTQASRRPRPTGPSPSKIINHYAADNEPRRSQCPLHRTANLRLPNARIITDRHLDNPESLNGPLQDHFNCPAAGGFLKCELMQDIGTRRAERAEVTDPHTIQKPDQAGREPVTQHSVPGQRPRDTLLAEA